MPMRANRHARRFIAPVFVAATVIALALAVAAQPASATSLSFVQHRPALGFDPFDVRPGDVDGDGIVDLVLRGGGGGPTLSSRSSTRST
jgi:hypothetical protein